MTIMRALGTYDWTGMPLGLKKRVEPPYQEAMKMIFHDAIGRFIEVYIND